MARAVTRCPNCGASVSQFAAGCAICGEDLVAARTKRQQRYDSLPTARLSLPAWASQVSGPEALLGGLLLLIAFFLPVVGFFVAGFIAFFAHRSDEIVQRNFALAAVGLALLVLVLISFFPGTWDELLPWVDLSGPLPS